MINWQSNYIKHRYSSVVYVITLLMLTGCSTVTTQSPPAFIHMGEAAMAPVGYLNYCTRRPDDCRASERPVVAVAVAAAAARPDTILAAADVAPSPAAPEALDHVRPLFIQATWPTSPLGRNGLEGSPGFIQASDDAEGRANPFGAARRYWAQPNADLETTGPVAPISPAAATPQLGDLFGLSSTTQAPAHYLAAPARTALTLDGSLLARLNETNRRINFAIRPKLDSETFGDSDYWHLPLLDGTGVGDCKDYVLEKRRAEGVPADALSIAIVRTRHGEGHAVLLVSTDQGEYVLDNLTPWVMPWKAVDYQWQKRQVPGQPLNWVSIGGAS